MRGLSLEVGAGEIVGIAGVNGNGQAELIDAITGLRPPTVGHDHGRRPGHHRREPPRRCSRPASATSPTDRQRRGLVLDFTLAENMALHDFDKPPSSPPRLDVPAAHRVRGRATAHRVRRARRPAEGPGGRRSRAATSRRSSSPARSRATPRCWWPRSPRAASTWARSSTSTGASSTERDEGRAILLVSLELEEVLSLSDRILVIFEGRIAAEFGAGADRDALGAAMLGGTGTERT